MSVAASVSPRGFIVHARLVKYTSEQILSFCLASAAIAYALALIWSFAFLPMVDAPQFAGLLTILQNYNDAPPHYEAYYALNFSYPYLLPALIGYVFALFLPSLFAFKLLLSLIVLATPASLYFLLARLQGPRWLGLLGFPLAFGFCFHWGFISFMAALPAGIMVLTFVASRLKGLDKPRDTFGLLICSGALLLSHGLMFLVVTVLCIALVVSSCCSRRSRFIVAFIGFCLCLWAYTNLVLFPASTSESLITDWALPSLGVLPSIGFLLGGERNYQLLWLSLILWVALFLNINGCWKRPWLLVPFSLMLLYQVIGPERIGFVGYIKERLLVLLVVTACLPLRASPGVVSRRFSQFLVLVVWLGSMWMHAERFAAFDRKTEGFEAVLEAVPPHQRLFYAVFDRDALSAGDNLLLHFPAWYQTLKKGHLAYSFTMVQHWPVLSRRKFQDWEIHRVWYPELFDWDNDSRNDYFLVGALADPTTSLFKEHSSRMELLKHEGRWWLYKKRAEQ